jgi:hypothetical protein
MEPTLYTVDRAGAGLLSTMAHPRGGDWLLDELHGLRRVGVEVLVSALTDSEEAELGLADEATACATAGLKFVGIPIPDRSVPDGETRPRRASPERALPEAAPCAAVSVPAGNHPHLSGLAWPGRSSFELELSGYGER